MGERLRHLGAFPKCLGKKPSPPPARAGLRDFPEKEFSASLREVPLVWDVHQKIPNEIQCAPSDEIKLAGQVCSPNQGRASACGRHFVLLRFERLRSQRSNSGIWQHGIQPVFVRCCHVARRVHRNGDITHRASRTSAGRIGIACSGGGEPWRWWWSAPKGVSAD